MLKSFLIRNFLYPVLFERQDRAIRKWRRNGSALPPPHILKQKTIRDIRRQFGLHTLVETGTFHGTMVDAQRYLFRSIYSIELSQQLYDQACMRFRKYPHIKLFQGDSAIVLPELLPHLKTAALFWLDGHYSGGETALGNSVTPVLSELNSILASPLPHIVLIDDARLFNGKDGYPTLQEVEALINRKRTDIRMEVLDDIIRLIPGSYLANIKVP